MQKAETAMNDDILPTPNINPELSESLLDRQVLSVTAEVYAEFLKRLDSPLKPHARLRRSLGTVAPWES